MGVIATNSNQITFYYNSNSSISKQALAYLQDSHKKILTIDISETKVTTTQWAEISTKLKTPAKDLINKAHPDYTKIYNSESDLSDQDWLKVIENNPEVVAFPILIVNNTFYKIDSPSLITQYL